MEIQQAKVSRNSIHDQSEEEMEVRRGPWTAEEDFTLINYIAHHGEGRWNSLARCAGLNRTGKSCRLRWLNYLRPDVRRGNITLEEQLLILELHSRWGNRWSKIAQHLPGRTDNEIKNYWRTRVQKHAKQLKCDVNSKQFKDTMRYLWMPRLLERIQASATTPAVPASSSTTTDSSVNYQNNINNLDMGSAQMTVSVPQPPSSISIAAAAGRLHNYSTPDQTSSAAASSDSFGTDHQVSPVSDLTDCYNYPVNEGNNHQDYYYCYNYPAANQSGYGVDQCLTSPTGYFNPGSGLDFQVTDQNNQWIAMDGGDVSDNLWNGDDMWFLQHQY